MKIENYNYLGQQRDTSEHFYSIGNTYFNIKRMIDFDMDTLSGTLQFGRYERKGRMAFNMFNSPFEETKSWAFPPAYDDEPTHTMQFYFTAANVLRMRVNYSNQPIQDHESIMIEELNDYKGYSIEKMEKGMILSTSHLHVVIEFEPFSVVIRDSEGKLLTKTLNSGDAKGLLNCNPIPFSYVRTVTDMKKYSAASFSISPGEHFYGCGESFTRLDKTGQKVVLWTKDAHSAETQDMYKPVPFYMSSRGYGIFTHTGASVTYDFGQSYQEAQTIFIGDDVVDLFIIAGTPKEILSAYTSVTGKAKVPPLWSFGLWMSRITYKSEDEVRSVVEKLAEFQIPCDVIHIDTGWFEHDWRCDYVFSENRFSNPKQMIADLKEDGYHICLWQLPYFTPNNSLFEEIVRRGYAIKNTDGKLPTDDAILDFTNPDALAWYQERIQALLELGVDAIKADFGEAAPLEGIFYNGCSGKVEHNLYPLRYNQAVEEVTQKVTGESIIWARSAWAGSQRYPLHWGGDSENTNMGMLGSLRGGLSLGLSGFTFWSHDAGGFVHASPEELYGRWMFMAIFSSHIRCHGAPPKEPWLYSQEFQTLFRKQVNFRYQMIPYIYAQSIKSAANGWPLMRAMQFEYPTDRNCLGIEDQYMFGDDLLIAPIFEDRQFKREVYLPEGTWLDLQQPEFRYKGKQWVELEKGELEGVILVKEGAAIPMVDLAQHTSDIDWETLYYKWYTHNEKICFGTGINPKDKTYFELDFESIENGYKTINQ